MWSFLTEIWVVPEFCMVLAGLCAGCGTGLVLKGLYHRRRIRKLRALAGFGNDPKRQFRDIPVHMLMGKRLWNPSVHFFAGMVLIACAMVVFWPGMGRTDYGRLGQIASLLLGVTAFLLPLCLVLAWAPAGLLPLTVFACILLLVQGMDASQNWTPLWQTRSRAPSQLEPANNPALLSAEYGLVGNDGYWVISPLSEKARQLFSRYPSPLRKLVRAKDPLLQIVIVLRETAPWLRPFSAPLHLSILLPGDPPAEQYQPLIAGLFRSGTDWWRITDQKTIKLEKRLLRDHGHVIYLDGGTIFTDLRDSVSP